MSVRSRRRPATRPTRAALPAFTLVELLVVIGIIALLMSILLPTLGRVKEQANSIKCLSNMRQLALAATTYTGQHQGYLVPADIAFANGDANGRTWSETWATILVGEGLVPYPAKVDPNSPPAGSDNVFQCPSGNLEMATITSIASGTPTARNDARGSFGYLHQSDGVNKGVNVFCWYGINGTASSTDPAFAYRRVTVGTATTATTGYVRANLVRNAASHVFLFDGVLGLNHQSTNPNRMNARHNNQKMTNLAFVDGHVESHYTRDLPAPPGKNGDEDCNPGSTTFSLSNLARYPHPKWRLDQQ
ncbi:MAG TPA: type II secretion system protein [Humisphaera sp.]